MERIFKTKTFSRWMSKSALTDSALCEAVSEMTAGLIDADLGGNVLKKRVALPGKGKSGGARTIVATKQGNHWFFIFGFNKNERSNISREELKALQEIATEHLEFSNQQLKKALTTGKIEEVFNDKP